MRLIKANLTLLYEDLIFLKSKWNEGETEGDIGIMGKKLANEVKDFCNSWKNILG